MKIIANAAGKSYFENMDEPSTRKNPAVKWMKRFGVAGFLFFLIKGLLWLALLITATFFGYDFFT